MKTTKAQRQHQLITRLIQLGFTYEEAYQLRRIEMTLHRWAEQECNGEIERDEQTDKPFRNYGNYVQANDPRRIHFIADREKGALKRLLAILDTKHPTLVHYHQTDPRGCALYILRQSEVGNQPIDSIYTRGVAVCD